MFAHAIMIPDKKKKYGNTKGQKLKMNTAFDKLNDLIVDLNEEYTCINRESEPTFDGYNEARLHAIRELCTKITAEALDLLAPDLPENMK